MSITLGSDDFIVSSSLKSIRKNESRRRTVSTSFEHHRKQPALKIELKSQSYAQDMTLLPTKVLKKQAILNSFIEKQSVEKNAEESFTKKIPCFGIILILVGITMFQSGSVIAKKLNVNPFLMVLIRDIIQASFNVPFLIHSNESSFPKGRRIILVVRGVVGGLLMMVHFYAIRYLPIADVMMISSIRPVSVTLLSCIFLKEACGILEIANLMLVISGISLVVQPSIIFGSTDQQYTDHMLYTALGLMAVNALGGSINVILRYLRDMHWAALAISTRIFGITEMFITCCFMGVFCIPSCGFERWGSLLLAIIGCLTQICFIFAIKNEEAHIIGLVDNAVSVIVSFLFQIIFFGDYPNILKIVGSCLVLSSIFIIGGQKIWKARQKETHS